MVQVNVDVDPIPPTLSERGSPLHVHRRVPGFPGPISSQLRWPCGLISSPPPRLTSKRDFRGDRPRNLVMARNRRSRRLKFARALAIENFEQRCLMAADVDLFSFRLNNGVLTNADGVSGTIVGDDPRLALAERMTDWLGSKLGMNIDRLSDATLAASVRDDFRGATGDAETVYTFAWEGMEWDFRVVDGAMEFVDPLDHGLHNPAAPMDINNDGVLAPVDALVVINFLNSAPTTFLPNRVPQEMNDMMVDVTGDRWVTPQDALIVINDLNDGGDSRVTRRLVAVDDYFSRTLPVTATEFPVAEIDVLENDTAGGGMDGGADGGDEIGSDAGLRVVAVGDASLGTAEIIVDAAGTGRTLVRYTPGESFRKFDFFTYTVEDAAGNRAEATVYVSIEVDPGQPLPFSVSAPAEIRASSPGAAILFRDAAGNGLISIQGDRNAPGSVGVLVSFRPNEPPYGLAIAGTLSSDIISLDATFYPQPGGEAWITGPIDQVNAILAGLKYDPAPGFSAPDGIGLNVYAFLYTPIGASAGFSSALVSLVVPRDPLAPVVTDDFFQFGQLNGPVRLNVLANDSSPSGSPLRLVSVSKLATLTALSVETSFGATIEVDRSTNEIVFRPGMIGSYEQFVYVVSDAAGRLSQGKVALTFNG